MNIYHAHGRDSQRDLFSFVVSAKTEETARRLVLEVLDENPIQFYCKHVGLAFVGDEEGIVW